MTSCAEGWHQLGQSDRRVMWFRLGTRLGDEYGTYIYRVGPVPDVRFCTTIWCYGDHGVPWTCSACGRAIERERYEPRQEPSKAT